METLGKTKPCKADRCAVGSGKNRDVRYIVALPREYFVVDRKRLFDLLRGYSLCFTILSISKWIASLFQICNKVLYLILRTNITATFYLCQFVTGNFVDIVNRFKIATGIANCHIVRFEDVPSKARFWPNFAD
jgi:hypothetical protein